VGLCVWRRSPGRLECVHCGRVLMTSSRTAGVVCPANPGPITIPMARSRGPGTEMKALLAGWPLYITSTENCPCNRHAALMDAWGCDECERRLDEIVGWLRAEAARRGLPFADLAGRLLVRRAISRARRHDPHRNRRQLPQNADETGI
jgi:predicted Fe-S protein YdhL (DUF1289 family)